MILLEIDRDSNCWREEERMIDKLKGDFVMEKICRVNRKRKV